MAMQSQSFSLSGLSAELGHDRRSLARWLDDLPPAAVDADGTKRWRIRDVLEHIGGKKSPAASSLEDDFRRWIAQHLFPAVFGGDKFVRVLTGALIEDVGLSKRQALRVYQLVILAAVNELEPAVGEIKFELPELACRLAHDGIDRVLTQWPDRAPAAADE